MERAGILGSSVARVLVTALVLAVLAASVDVRGTLAAFLSADLRWLLLAALTILSIRAIVAIRWWQILAAYGFSIGLRDVTKLILVTSSFGSVLPGGVGQDLLRGYHVARTEGRIPEVSASIIVDRLLGILSMALVAGVAGLLAMESLERSPSLRVAVLAAYAILVAFAALYPLRRRLRRWRPLGKTLSAGAAQRLADLSTSVLDHPVGGGVLLSVLVLSVLAQLARTLAFILVFTALGASAESLHYFVAIPIVFLVLQLPISLGGLGVREVALVVLLRDAGFAPEISVAGGLIFQCLQLAAHLPGLVLFLADRSRRRSRATG